jgi:hypothetical protein
VRRRTLRRRRDGSFRTTVPPLPEGVYRLSVEAVDSATPMTPVADLVAVIDSRKRKR